MLRNGDTLVIWKLDRLGRSLRDLLEIVERLEKSGVQFLSLTEDINTKAASGKLTFHVFAILAEFERNLFRERTKAGLATARARGRLGGARRKTTKKEDEGMRALWDGGRFTAAELANQFGISVVLRQRLIMPEELKKETRHVKHRSSHAMATLFPADRVTMTCCSRTSCRSETFTTAALTFC